ncbi:MmgE/PrpD family protein [uncultured Cohaesibacter sp.]|uniref:MmgE/PrpD family protein n=1 Tax=uncultured Cohaesibacter sp. TaxID=1002546 RepID=UPI0029C664D8|nr:MmgE/PrpD family protein [uncultured Cohaesibacter sp.]
MTSNTPADAPKAINPMERIARHVVETRLADLPAGTVQKIQTFLLDTIGVGIAGSRGAGVPELIDVARGWGDKPEATVWLTGEKMSAQSAAIVNAYQVHCLEFDCVHEGAVLHPMATILSAVMAWAEREAARGSTVSGAQLIPALAVGVDVSTMLGIVTDAPIRFFRPATAGGFGAVAALANLQGFDQRQVMDAMGAQYAQACGTLQPHVEGSPMLGMQVGFNSAAAIRSVDLAKAGFRGPHDIMTGQYGYFRLFEEDSEDLASFLPTLGREWQIDAMSHKPWPTGRLTHGAVDGLGQILAREGLTPADVAKVEVKVPALNYRLVGRPVIADPEPNYAKLCLRFVAGIFLAKGAVDVPDFLGEALLDPSVHDFASRIDVVLDEANPDMNALNPQTITVTTTTGTVHTVHLPYVFGSPENPLTPEQNEEKFRRCATYGRAPLVDPQKLIDAVAGLENLSDVSTLARMTTGQEA